MSLLTLDELKAWPGIVGTTIGDATLQLLLDAAEAAVEDAAGEYVDGYEVASAEAHVERVRGALIALPREASSIVSVTERADCPGEADLATTDYRLLPGGSLLKRLGSWWRPPVDVVFVPEDDLVERKAAQANLVKLEIAFNPGLASETVGAWTETYTGSGRSYQEQRADILAGLSETADGGVW